MISRVITFILLVSFILSVSPKIEAQSNSICGTTDIDDITKRLLENKKLFHERDVVRNGDIQYVPVTFHLVAATDGTGRVKLRQVTQQLCRLNNDYADQNIQFYFAGLVRQ